MASDQQQPPSDTPKPKDTSQKPQEPPKPEAKEAAAPKTGGKSAALASLQERMGMSGATADAGDAEAPPAEKPKHHDDLIAELRREISDLKDKILRAHAEVDNIRKRTEREKIDTAKYAVTKFAQEIVNVGDNFQRAITAVPAGAAEADPALASLLEGVNLTEREFLNVLERHGVERVDPMGEAFNPHLHQAVMEMPQPDVPSGTVVQVFQSGFTIGDRVLRPAMVVVATGGVKPDTGPAQPAAAPATPEPPDTGST
jgi:molecular chaperone GrpE